MQAGVSKHWTPEMEEGSRKRIDSCRTFAERNMVMLLRDMLKYDGRTKQWKEAIAKARLRLATATDEELKQMAELDIEMTGQKLWRSVQERLEELKKQRAELQATGIERSELGCL